MLPDDAYPRTRYFIYNDAYAFIDVRLFSMMRCRLSRDAATPRKIVVFHLTIKMAPFSSIISMLMLMSSII